MVSFHRFRPLLPFIIGVLGFGVQACAEWNEKVLYSFQGTPDGATPAGGVALGSDGNLYGATTEGGADNCPGIAQCGTVFQLKPPAQEGGKWTETVLYVFKGKTVNDGSTPAGGVILDKAGNIYGTTGYGGAGDCVLLGGNTGCGTVWELSPPKEKGGKWTEEILYSFKSAKNGWLPQGDLTFDAAGNLYGATEFGGSEGTSCNGLFGGQCGTVFELSPPTKNGGKWTEKVLHNFAGIASGKDEGDGGQPNGGLVLDGAGAIYGTTYIGGYNCPHNSNQGCGTVFRLKPPTNSGGNWAETLVYVFKGPDGGEPAAGVVLGGNGSLYGTTKGGGADSGEGTVFEVVPDMNGTWKEQVLHSFTDGPDGGWPEAGLLLSGQGDLFGTASAGGSGGGTVFRMQRDDGKWSLNGIYSFKPSPDGFSPASGLTPDQSGSFYGTTNNGGGVKACGNPGCGTVFQLND
jgi:hypothetical protein